MVKDLYDTLRVVDPESKKIFVYHDKKLIEKNIICYEDLDRAEACENCISIRALNNNTTYMKIESVGDKTSMITAIPVNFQSRKVVVEFIKDVTNSLFYENITHGDSCKINNFINDLKDIAIKDELTKVYNRRYINEKLPQDVKSCIKGNKPISIILTDIDYFKKVNDTFGHVYGDHILNEFAQRLKSSIRGEKDWIGRYGGEEFLICIPDADEDIAYKIAERMRKAIKREEMVVKDKKIKVTASFGVYTIYDNSKSMEEYINCADKKLYLAKKLGRNKIVV